MNTRTLATSATLPAVAVNDCWNHIGLYGDRSCGQLAQLTHCRNCPVYAESARTIMQRALPADYQRDWASQFAAPRPPPASTDRSALVFRIGCEWLCLPTHLCITVAEIATPHRLPHRSNPVLSGIVSVKGQLYPCMSLAALMAVGAEDAPTSSTSPSSSSSSAHQAYPRLLVMQLGQQAFALPVQALRGVYRYASADLRPPPATANQTVHRYLTGVLDLEELKVGCLDAELVGYQLAGALK